MRSVHRTGSTIADPRQLSVRGGRLLDRAGKVLSVGPEPLLVGRDPACNLVLDDPHVSAVHAELVATENGVRLRDLGSRNGTWVGEVRLVEAYLHENVRLSFGPMDVAFELAEPARVDLAKETSFGRLFGENPRMRQLFGRLAKVAPTELTVLVQGETGTGKELVAQAIHDASPRRDGPFVVVDCGAISPTLAESLLFGHEKGAFTGAVDRRESPFVEAEGGTVFLDELGELPLDVQPKLLRALAERRVQSVGGQRYRDFDARIVAATRRDLTAAINDGSFRSDLYFRVAQVRVEVPSLRERIDDIPGLVREILAANGAPDAWRRVPREVMMRLLRHDWPGNVRELSNAVSVALALAGDDGTIDVTAHVSFGGGPSAETPFTRLDYHGAKREVLARFERSYFSVLLSECGGSIVEVSRRAGLQRTHVRRYMNAHGLLPTRRKGS
jgi:DNA-binding NtrC family response regulator